MRAELVEVDLWRQFHAQQNEMIITKAGRCLFPLFRVRFVPEEGMPLEEEREYRVSISIEPMDENKWKWRQGRWIPLLTSRLGMDETPEQIVCYERLKGSEISFGGLNFDKIKLTNRDSDSPMTVCLQSFHRYIPTVQIVECDNPQRIQTLRFPETEFIAVTHYQNEQVTVLKKSYNPHAKGFVLSEGSPTQGTVDWLLTPAVTPESPKEQKRRRTRKRIRPITFDAIPSDEEELQGSIALQLLGSKDDD